MANDFVSHSDQSCHCDETQATRGFIKDTLCGRSEFTNFIYIFIAVFNILELVIIGYFHWKMLPKSGFVFRTRLKVILFFFYLYTVGSILKSFDIVIHYGVFAYIIIQDTAIFMVFCQLVYLTVWIKVILQTYDNGTPRFKNRVRSIVLFFDILVTVLCCLYTYPLITTIADKGASYTAANPYHEYSIGIFTFMPIAYLVLGVWMAIRIHKVKDLLFSTTSRMEVAINILMGALFPLLRGLYDWVDVFTDIYPQQQDTCNGKSIFWGFVMLYNSLTQTFPVLFLSLFLIVSQNEMNDLRHVNSISTQNINKEFLRRLKSSSPNSLEEQPIVIDHIVVSQLEQSGSEGFSVNSGRVEGTFMGSFHADKSSFIRRWGHM